MSCIQISLDTLAGVRETIKASFYWTTNYEETPLCVFDSFFPRSSRYSISAHRVEEKAEEFVANAMLFNLMELDKGEEPQGYQESLAALAEYGKSRKRLGIWQFYKSLQFIDYNTDVCGQMTAEQYEKWPMREQYEKFHSLCNRLCNRLAKRFVSKMPQYEQAVWG